MRTASLLNKANIWDKLFNMSYTAKKNSRVSRVGRIVQRLCLEKKKSKASKRRKIDYKSECFMSVMDATL